jgi:hypothetical protein
MANTVLAKMVVQIAANSAEFNKAMQQTSKSITGFTNTLKNVAGTIGVAFGVQQVASFGLEIAKLAGQAEGVSAAFKRLPNSIKLLEELKTATGNTVSELELMKRAVQASNFDISLKSLPRLLEFATLRAQQTGQSVDYLVDSIVTGIGRKSKLILDNLGISATQLAAEFKGASLEAQSVADVTEAVGRIAERNLKNMAGFSENAATKIQQLTASWENFKVSLGQAVNSAGTSTAGKHLDAFLRSMTFLVEKFTGRENPFDDLRRSINRFNREQPQAEEFLEQYEHLKEVAEAANIKLILLTDSATGLRKIMVDPRTPFLNAIANNATPAIDAMKELDEAVKKIQERYDKLNSLSRKKFEAPLEAGKLGDATGSLVDPNFLKIDTKSIVEGLKPLPEQVKPAFVEMQNLFSDVALSAEEAAGIIGDSFSNAFSGAFSGVQILAQATSQIVNLFAKQAISAAIANAAKAGGKFPLASVAFATIAAGAMTGLLSRVGVRSTGGFGGSSGSSFSRPTLGELGGNANFQDTTLTFKLQGNDLVAAYKLALANNGSRRA